MINLNKLLFPYEKGRSYIFHRRNLLGNNIGSVYYVDDYHYDGWKAIIYYGLFYKQLLSSKDAAMEILDEELINQGYILLTTEQADKYKLLL